MIASLIESLGPWNWIVLGLVLLGIEVLVPGTFMLWLGLAAIATGLLAFTVAMGWQMQALSFAVLSVLAVLVWWFAFRQSRRTGDEQAMPLTRTDIYIGRTYVLDQPIENGLGRLHIDDTSWRIAGPDLAAGTKVRVESAEGTLLRVAPLA